MSVADQLLAGLSLTIAGMVTVFLLLTFMVFLIGWMSRLANRLQPPARSVPMGSTGAGNSGLDPKIVSAISVAVHRYRQKHR